ncbi:sugar transferase [candidate division KSB1 bacterium]|nr:sugar transferase [candidate division KSB1 bacterium]RQW10215.1 MAG: sugar transferase [candidate division KSB1 bacterium]
MLVDKEKFIQNVMQFIDLLILYVAFPLAYYVDEFIRYITFWNVKAYATSVDVSGLMYFASKYWIMFIGFPLIWWVLYKLNKIYQEYRTRTFKNLAWILFVTSIWASFVCGSFVFFLKFDMASRLFFLVYSGTAYTLIILEKAMLLFILERMHAKGYNQENLLIVGTGNRAREFIRNVKGHSNWGLHIVGLIDDDPRYFGKEIEGYRVLGRIQDIGFIVNRLVIDRVIFVVPRIWLDRIEGAILECEKVGVSTSISLDLYNLHIAKARQTDFNGFPLLEFQTFYAKEWQLFIKRVLDICISACAIVFFSPLIMLVALLIRITSKGPIFFRQERIGLNGRKFSLYKFRSMVSDAEALKESLAHHNEMDGPVFKIKHDPRITPIGYLIRKTSIDEIPQFFNVLKGDMSIVGPRPPLRSEVEHYEIWQRRRLSLKPGITCIWQVSGRNKIGFEEWMRMDLEYIDHWSLVLDLKLMFRTFWVVITGYGAQ